MVNVVNSGESLSMMVNHLATIPLLFATRCLWGMNLMCPMVDLGTSRVTEHSHMCTYGNAQRSVDGIHQEKCARINM